MMSGTPEKGEAPPEMPPGTPFEVAQPPSGAAGPGDTKKYPEYPPQGYPTYSTPLPPDWEDLDSIGFDCLCCPCTYNSALLATFVWAIVLLAVFEITPMALYNYGWLYWDQVLYSGVSVVINGITYTTGAAAAVQMKSGWYKAQTNFGPYPWDYRKIEDVFGFNGSHADASQGLGETCGALAVVGTFFCLIYILVLCAMFKPRENRKLLLACNRKFVPAFACFLGLVQFTFAFAFFGKAAVDWQNYWKDIAAAAGLPEPSDSNITLWPTYAWFFFLFGSITWPLLGFSMASFPIPGESAMYTRDDAKGPAVV